MRLPGGQRGGLSLSLQGQLGAARARTEGPAGAGRGPCAFTAEGWPGGVATPSPPGLVARRGLCLPKLLLVVEKKKKKEVLAKYTLLLSHSCTWALSGAAPWFEATLRGSAQHCSLLGHPWVLPASPGAWCGCDGLEFLEFWESRGSLPLFPLPSSLLLAEVRV